MDSNFNAPNEEYPVLKKNYKYSTRFDGLVQGTEYTVSLSTEVDGKTITQVTILAIRGSEDDHGKDKDKKKEEKKDKKKDDKKK